jgi:hypothetical protein
MEEYNKFCHKCGQKSEGTPFCLKCGTNLLSNSLFSDSTNRPVVTETKSLPDRLPKNYKRYSFFIIVIAVAGLCILPFLSFDKEVEFCGERILFSKSCQRYMQLVGEEHYEGSKGVIIVDEPHYDLAGQWNLYKGLEVFLADNPHLLEECVFLAEGVDAGYEISIEPLIDVDNDPSEKIIGATLSTFLIPGYVAYEWYAGKGIEITGIEDPLLYKTSAHLWAENIVSDAWLLTVTARNLSMAESIRNALADHKNVFIFVGGRHLVSMKEETFDSAKQDPLVVELTDTVEQLRNSENIGLADFLRRDQISYVHLTPFLGASVSSTLEQRYRELFKAQEKDDYKEYIESVVKEIAHDQRPIPNQSYVTVCPSPDAAAQFVAAFKAGSGEDEGKKENEGNKNKGKKKKTGKVIGGSEKIHTDHPHGPYKNGHRHWLEKHTDPKTGKTRIVRRTGPLHE